MSRRRPRFGRLGTLVRRFTQSVFASALVAGIAFGLRPGDRAVVTDVFLLVLGGLVLTALVQGTREMQPANRPSVLDEALDEAPPPRGALPALDRVEREVVLSSASAFDFHHRLRPLLHEIADDRLRRRRGIDLAREPEQAHAVLGDAVWELVRPGREPPRDRHAPGLPVAQLRAVLDELDRV